VDLPAGRDPTPGPSTAEGEKETEPRLYLLSVRLFGTLLLIVLRCVAWSECQIWHVKRRV
jgi:hypothetical protein